MANFLKRLKVSRIIVVAGVIIATIFFANIKIFFDQSKPEIGVVSHLESILVMPRHARPLPSYIRYYSQEIIQGKKYIVATFLYNGSLGRIELIEAKKRPVIEDGGCDVIELRYSLVDNRIVSFSCNGFG